MHTWWMVRIMARRASKVLFRLLPWPESGSEGSDSRTHSRPL